MIDKAKKRLGLTASLVLLILGIMVVATLLAGLLVMFLNSIGVLDILDYADIERGGGGSRVLLTIIFSITLGTGIAIFLSKKALNPIRSVIEATHRVAEGDFSVRVESKGIRELEELSYSFNKMVQELSTTKTLRRDFINNFSHEFKTPILSMRGFAKLLREGNLSENEKREYLDIIIIESERLAGLATNILSLSKYENIEIITDKVSFQMDEQIRRALVLTEPKWSAKDIEFDVEMDEVVFDGNEDLTQQIWLNLLDNAIKFSNPNSKINIRLSRWNNGVRFIIQDDGIGMDKKTTDSIFEKFYQGDLSRSKSGNGLGLSIVKRITELHGGNIEVESVMGKGSTFTIHLSDNPTTNTFMSSLEMDN